MTQSLVLLEDGNELATVDPLDRDDPDECELRLVAWVERDLTEDPLLGVDLGAWFILKFGVVLCTAWFVKPPDIEVVEVAFGAQYLFHSNLGLLSWGR